MSGIITVTASIVATVFADRTGSPAIIGDDCVPNRAEMKRAVPLTRESVLENRSIHSPLSELAVTFLKPSGAERAGVSTHIPVSRPGANSSTSLKTEFLHYGFSEDNLYETQSPDVTADMCENTGQLLLVSTLMLGMVA